MLLHKIKEATENLGEKSAIIVAHPDDEVLWFSSILEKVDDVVLVYNDYAPLAELGAGRKEALKHHPCRSLIQLAIDEPVSFNKAMWSNPSLTKYGIQFQSSEDEGSYQKAFGEVVEALQVYLNEYRPTTIFTHNPWGEYGHEDHVQVYRALRMLQGSFGFKLWVSCYAHNKTKILMRREIKKLANVALVGQPNEALYEQVKEIYQATNVWTWNDSYTLPKKEFFFAVDDTLPDSEERSGLFGYIALIKSIYVLELDWPYTDNFKWKDLGLILKKRIKKYIKKILRIAKLR